MTQGEYDFYGNFFGDRKANDDEKNRLIRFLGNALIVHFILDLVVIAIVLYFIVK